MSDHAGESRRDHVDPTVTGAVAGLRGVFTPVTAEVDVTDLRIDGRLPDALRGEYLRNGPNPRGRLGEGFCYPRDGEAMLHRVQLRDGRARYTNRSISTPARTPGDVADAEGGYAANVGVLRHAGRLLALADSRPPLRLSAALLVLGAEDFHGALPDGLTGHPKIDPASGELVGFCSRSRPPYLTSFVVGADGAVRRPPIPVPGLSGPSTVHDMALTAGYIVLMLCPTFLTAAATRPTPTSPGAAAATRIAGCRDGGAAGEPDAATRIALIPRDGGPVIWSETEAFWSWHTANAFETMLPTGRAVVVDYVRWTLPDRSDADRSRRRNLSRLTLFPDTGSLVSEQLLDDDVEFPRIDERLVARPHTTIGSVLTTGRDPLLPCWDADALSWYDTDRRQLITWWQPDLAVGEQIFVPDTHRRRRHRRLVAEHRHSSYRSNQPPPRTPGRRARHGPGRDRAPAPTGTARAARQLASRPLTDTPACAQDTRPFGPASLPDKVRPHPRTRPRRHAARQLARRTHRPGSRRPQQLGLRSVSSGRSRVPTGSACRQHPA